MDFISSELRGVKASRSSRESYGDNAIGYVQVKRDGAICTVKARITPEHKVRTKAYAVTLITDEEQGTVESCVCEDCPASQDSLIFKELFYAGSLYSQYVKDTTIFTHENVLHQHPQIAAVIEENLETGDDYLSFYSKIKNNPFGASFLKERIQKSFKIYSFPFTDGTIVILGHDKGLSIYHLNINSYLHKKQTLNLYYPYNDLTIWNYGKTIYLVVAIDHIADPRSNDHQYESTSPIYIWRGNHFDFFQYIPTANAKRIISFNIGGSTYIGVANHQNNYGETRIFSEVFKYDNHEKKFISWQKLASECAVNIQYFCIQDEAAHRSCFLLITNELMYGSGASSHLVIYKAEKNIFVPFQNLESSRNTQWVALGHSGKFIILALAETSESIYEYNGWKFIKRTFGEQSWLANIPRTFVKPFFMDNKSGLSITEPTSNGTTIHLYFPSFKVINEAANLKNEIMFLTDNIKKLLSCKEAGRTSESLKKMLPLIKNQSPIDHSSKIHNKNFELSSTSVNIIQTQAIHANDINLDQTVIRNLNSIYQLFHKQRSSLKILEDVLTKTVSTNSYVTLKSLNVNNIKFSCTLSPCSLNNIDLINLQNYNIPKYQRDVLYSNHLDNYLEFEVHNLIVEETLNVVKVNGKPIDHIYYLLEDLTTKLGINVTGNVYLSNGLSVAGLFDGVNMIEEKVLLKDGDQTLKGSMFIQDVKSNTLETSQINDLTDSLLKDIMTNENKSTFSPYTFGKLTVQSIFAQGLTNGFDIGYLFENALKIEGNQEIYEKATVMNLEALDISQYNSENYYNPVQSMISTSEGFFEIFQDVRFQKLNAYKMIIKQRLNNIPIINGELSVLMLNSPTMQRITGNKVFQNVELMGPINLQGRINSRSLEMKNPVTMIDQPLVLTGNFSIKGNISIENQLVCEKMSNGDETQSVNQLNNMALKLTDSHIHMPVVFSEPFKVKHLFCDYINGINPFTWISTDADNVITIPGRKVFLYDLSIQERCSIIETINGVNPTYFDEKIFRTDLDQAITGQIFFSSVYARSLKSKNIVIGGISIENILTNTVNKKISGVTTINDKALVNNLLLVDYVKSVTVGGYNFNYLYEDTLNSNHYLKEIKSNIFFLHPIQIINSDIGYVHEIDPEKLQKIKNWSNYVIFTNYLSVKNSLNLKNLIFDYSISGISKYDFHNGMLLKNEDQIIYGRQYFTSIECLSPTYVKYNIINDYFNIEDVKNNTIWVNEDVHLPKVIFKAEVTTHNLVLEGLINGLDVQTDFVLKNHSENQILNIFGNKVIKGNIAIQQLSTASVCSVDLEHLCIITNLKNSENPFKILIEGSLNFANEPEIKKINGMDVNQLTKELWFSDVPTTLQEANYFKKAKFLNPISVSNLSSGPFDLARLSSKYFSLSRDQEATGFYNLSELYSIDVNVYKETRIDKLLNGIDFNFFEEQTLQSFKIQTINYPFVFETVEADELNLYGKMNNLSLAFDVFLINGPNIISQGKEFDELHVLQLMCNCPLQTVNVSEWSKNAVKKTNSDKNVIKGNKTLKASSIHHLRNYGYINGKIISEDTILNKMNPQILNGKKTFLNRDHLHFFKSVVAKKNINGFDVNTAFENMAFQNGEGAIVITGTKIASADIIAENIYITGGLYNGQNVSKILHSLMEIRKKQIHNSLQDKLIQMVQSISTHIAVIPKKIQDLKLIQVIEGNIPSQYILRPTSNILVAMRTMELSFFYLYNWDPVLQNFLPNKDMSIFSSYDTITSLHSVDWKDEPTVVIETKRATNNDEHFERHLLTFTQQGTRLIETSIARKTKSIVGIQVAERNCLVVVYDDKFLPVELHCKNTENKLDRLTVHQIIHIKMCTKVITAEIKEVTYVVVACDDGTYIMRWSHEGRGSLAIFQSLPTSSSLSVQTWNNQDYLATFQTGFINIYIFNKELLRYEVKQTIEMTGSVEINLSVVFGNHLLSVLIPTSPARLMIYEHCGIAGFQYKFTHFIPTSSVLTNIHNIPVNDNVHILTLGGVNEIQILEFVARN